MHNEQIMSELERILFHTLWWLFHVFNKNLIFLFWQNFVLMNSIMRTLTDMTSLLFINSMKAEAEKKEMNTLVSCLNTLMAAGFETQFKATKNGLKSLTTEIIYQPDEIKVLNFYRFEGESDPADNSILYAIETKNGERGTLTDAYGPYSDSNVTRFMKQVEEIEKKVQKEKKLN